MAQPRSVTRALGTHHIVGNDEDNVRLFSGILLRVADCQQQDENPDPSAMERGTTTGEPSSAHRHEARAALK